ncbi:MAG TPA: 3-hydroxybutyryl-CoA dehydrogenase [Burkholderiales bacterium]
MSIKKVGVVGAGTMGNGIAQVCAAAGVPVAMLDVNQAALDRGLATVRQSLERLVAKGKLSAPERDAVLERIRPTLSQADLADADLLIEAATENEELKLKLLAQLDEVLGPQALIASNTSSISITRLAAATRRPDRFIGMHFFNPVPVMALVELIRGVQTSDATHAAAAAFVQQIGKHPITVRNSPGFVVNRILCPMINEAFMVLGEGLASAEDIDEGMKLGCNHPIGPLALADLIGLDTMLAVMEVLHAQFGDPKYRPALMLRELVAAGRLGRKSGWGVYRYAK